MTTFKTEGSDADHLDPIGPDPLDPGPMLVPEVLPNLGETLTAIAALPYDARDPACSVRRAVEVARAGLRVDGLLLRAPEFPVVAEGCPAVRLLELEDRLGEGPSLGRGVLEAPRLVESARDEPAWPTLAAVLADDPPVSLIVAGVGGDAGTVGRLVALSADPAALRGMQQDVGLVARAVGAVLARDRALLDAGRRVEQLRQAMLSRAIIEQAKGMIMLERGCDADAAFELMASASQRMNVKLRVLAERLVSSVREASAGPPGGPRPLSAVLDPPSPNAEES